MVIKVLLWGQEVLKAMEKVIMEDMEGHQIITVKNIEENEEDHLMVVIMIVTDHHQVDIMIVMDHHQVDIMIVMDHLMEAIEEVRCMIDEVHHQDSTMVVIKEDQKKDEITDMVHHHTIKKEEDMIKDLIKEVHLMVSMTCKALQEVLVVMEDLQEVSVVMEDLQEV